MEIVKSVDYLEMNKEVSNCVAISGFMIET